MLYNDEINEEKILAATELMATIATARFKSIKADDDYEGAYDYEEIEELLELYYPLGLFEEIYDPPNQHRDGYVLKEFNPNAGAIIRSWATGMTWEELCRKYVHEKFGQGDLMNVIYRVATYLQSIAMAKPSMRATVRALRDVLRPPLLPND